MASYPKASWTAFFYSFTVVTLGASAMITNWRKSQITYEKPNSYYRGDSIFFNWLDLVKLKIKGSEIVLNKEFIWLFVEPLAVLGLAAILFASGFDKNFGYYLLISSIALFMEELRELRINREDILDIFDGEHKAERIEEKLVKYNRTRWEQKRKPIGAVLSKRKS